MVDQMNQQKYVIPQYLKHKYTNYCQKGKKKKIVTVTDFKVQDHHSDMSHVIYF